MEVFDEDKAVAFILDTLAADKTVETKYSEDDILEVIDIIWDYYEDNGMLDLDLSLDDNDSEADKETLIAHVTKMLAKDKDTRVRKEDVPAIVEAELAYEAKCDELD